MYFVNLNGKAYTITKMLNPLAVEAIQKQRKQLVEKHLDMEPRLLPYYIFFKDNMDYWALVNATLRQCFGFSDEELEKLKHTEAAALFEYLVTFSSNIKKEEEKPAQEGTNNSSELDILTVQNQIILFKQLQKHLIESSTKYQNAGKVKCAKMIWEAMASEGPV